MDCCVTNAFILVRECRPARCGGRKGVKSFRLQLAQVLIGDYNIRQWYSLPAVIHEVVISRSTAPPVQRGEPAVSSTGHFPVCGAKGRCCYCWNIKQRRKDSTFRCQQCQRCFCLDSRNKGEASCFEWWHRVGHVH